MRVFLLLLVVCSSCLPPVPPSVLNLNLLPQSASLPARIDNYDNYMIVETSTKSVYRESNGNSLAYSYIESATLRNGNEIREHKVIADELPGTAVEEHYKNALAIAETTKKPRRIAKTALVIGLIGSPLVVPFFAGLLIHNAIIRKNNEIEKKALRELDLVFLTYNETLRNKLNLCVDPTIVTVEGDALVECTAEAP